MRVRDEDVNTETMIAPAPIVAVMESFREISSAYVAARAVREPFPALEVAVAKVLDENEAAEVLPFIRGQDDRFGAGVGAQFVEVTLKNMESQFDYERRVRELMSRAPAERPTPVPTDDIVDLAEWYAGNQAFAFMYRYARGEEYCGLGQSFLQAAVEDTLQIASRARTGMGRRVKIEQAEKVFSLLAKKASAYPGVEGAENQVIWCNAVVAALKGLRK